MAKSLPFASLGDAELEMEHVDATSLSCSTLLKRQRPAKVRVWHYVRRAQVMRRERGTIW